MLELEAQDQFSDYKPPTGIWGCLCVPAFGSGCQSFMPEHTIWWPDQGSSFIVWEVWSLTRHPFRGLCWDQLRREKGRGLDQVRLTLDH